MQRSSDGPTDPRHARRTDLQPTAAGTLGGSTASALPLCVDLDGTLLRGDVLVEATLRLVSQNPLRLALFPSWLARGRPWLKRELARRIPIDPAGLAYNPEFLAYLRQERRAGRRIVLVTAAAPAPARAIARYLDLFDEVIASDGTVNLKGAAKRAELVRRYGERGFDYAGNSTADLPVWDAARRAIVVQAPRRVLRLLDREGSMVLDAPTGSRIGAMVEAMRIRQWIKNLLVFLPTLLAHRYLDPTPLLASVLAFFSLSCGASAFYVLNDVLDVEADRYHPVKRRRPFARGDLPLHYALFMVPALAGASLALALPLPRTYLFVLLLYFAMTTAYSLRLKQLALIDIMVLAGFYTLRIIAGSAATTVQSSEWLLAFSMFLFLSLGAVKRYAEIRRLREDGTEQKIKRRGYFADDRELVMQMGLCSGYIAVLVLALYITSDSVTRLYARPQLLWVACVLILFWISRIWLLAHRGEVEDDPLNFAVRDPTTWGVALIGAAAMFFGSRGL